ncbi:hypothetical protein PENTCL1PPCAC_3287, partial [Pristionchus entomophagus]
FCKAKPKCSFSPFTTQGNQYNISPNMHNAQGTSEWTDIPSILLTICHTTKHGRLTVSSFALLSLSEVKPLSLYRSLLPHSQLMLTSLPTPSTFSNHFNVIRVDDSNARSEPPYTGTIQDRVYGGLLVSQAANAFIKLRPGCFPRTVNYKFVAPAVTNLPLRFQLSCFEDGESARALTYQNEKLIGITHVRYSNEPTYSKSPSVCPEYGSASAYPSVDVVSLTVRGWTKALMKEMLKFPVEVRPVESLLYPLSEVDRTATWLRVNPESREFLKSSDGVALLLFLSDFTIVQVACEIYERSTIRISSISSLHHSVWIHEANIDPFGWYLVTVECKVISYGRARLESNIFNESRKCVMTVIQEGYFQRARASKMPRLLTYTPFNVGSRNCANALFIIIVLRSRKIQDQNSNSVACSFLRTFEFVTDQSN